MFQDFQSDNRYQSTYLRLSGVNMMPWHDDLTSRIERGNAVVIKNKFIAQIINHQIIVISKIDVSEVVELIPI